MNGKSVVDVDDRKSIIDGKSCQPKLELVVQQQQQGNLNIICANPIIYTVYCAAAMSEKSEERTTFGRRMTTPILIVLSRVLIARRL